jgi:hypothetical protein
MSYFATYFGYEDEDCPNGNNPRPYPDARAGMTPAAPSLASSQPHQMVRKLELPALSDDMLGDYRCAVIEHSNEFKQIGHAIDLEFERRLRERGARSLPHTKFDKIELDDQWSAYEADFEALNEAAQILRALGHDDEAAKIAKHVPERSTIVPAHDEYGAPVSIAALIRKYGDKSQIGMLLLRGLKRQHLGTKLVIKAKPIV